MPQFEVEEQLAALVERLAKPKPFEHLSFNDALWRVVGGRRGAANTHIAAGNGVEHTPRPEVAVEAKKTRSPSCRVWVESVPELKGKKGLDNWQAVCTHLKLDTGGDSARRVLKSFVNQHKPSWPQVPALEGD